MLGIGRVSMLGLVERGICLVGRDLVGLSRLSTLVKVRNEKRRRASSYKGGSQPGVGLIIEVMELS